MFEKGGKNEKGHKWRYNNQEMEIVKEYISIWAFGSRRATPWKNTCKLWLGKSRK